MLITKTHSGLNCGEDLQLSGRRGQRLSCCIRSRWWWPHGPVAHVQTRMRAKPASVVCSVPKGCASKSGTKAGNPYDSAKTKHKRCCSSVRKSLLSYCSVTVSILPHATRFAEPQSLMNGRQAANLIIAPISRMSRSFARYAMPRWRCSLNCIASSSSPISSPSRMQRARRSAR